MQLSWVMTNTFCSNQEQDSMNQIAWMMALCHWGPHSSRCLRTETTSGALGHQQLLGRIRCSFSRRPRQAVGTGTSQKPASLGELTSKMGPWASSYHAGSQGSCTRDLSLSQATDTDASQKPASHGKPTLKKGAMGQQQLPCWIMVLFHKRLVPLPSN